MQDGSVVSGNTANDGGGGGVKVYRDSELIMESGSIISNNSSATYGGGVWVQSGKIYMDNGTTISGNSSGNGGGVHLWYTADGYYPSDAILSGSIIDNTASNGGGVGIYKATTKAIDFQMADIILSGNTAYANGGGAYIPSSATVNITGASSFTDNTAGGDGGGIYTEDTTYANLSSDSATAFSGNRASDAYAPPADAASVYPNIQFTSTSITNHPLNNYDINYLGTQPLLFTLTYDAGGGTGSYIVADITPGNSVTVLSSEETGISRENFTFTGWNTEADGSGTPYAPTDEVTVYDNMTLYAQWAINEYTVTFDSNGGSGVDSQSVSYGAAVIRPEDPTKEGYTFDGWYTDDGIFENSWDFDIDTVSGDMTLYAKWTETIQQEIPAQPTEPIGSTEQTQPTEIPGTTCPQTGDSGSMILWILVFCGSLSMLVVLFRKIRKGN